MLQDQRDLKGERKPYKTILKVTFVFLLAIFLWKVFVSVATNPGPLPELPGLMKQIRALGYKIKLDTNGSQPDRLKSILDACGPDSRAGMVASVMLGSSETVFYTCGVYLAAAGVKKSRHIIPCALIAWLAGSIAAGLMV